MDRRNGGTSLAPPRPPKSLPRVHRPRAPDPSCVTPVTAPATFARRRLSPVPPHLASIPLGGSAPPASGGVTLPVLLLPIDQPIGGVGSNPASNPTTPVTLAAPRPENERLANEYVDTPFGRGHNNGATAGIGTGNIIPSTTGGTALAGGGLLQSVPAAGGVQQQQQQHRHVASESELPRTVITGQPRPTALVDRSARSPHGTNNHNNNNNNHASDIIRVVKSVEGRHGVTTATMTPMLSGNGGQGLTADVNGIARSSSIITKQPTKKKDGSDRHELLELELHHHHHHHHRHHHGHHTAVATVGGGGGGGGGPGGLGGGVSALGGTDGLNGIGSITCPRCRRCRCEECLKPRPLPSHWLCDKSCLCSAETIIDYASCLCCVKALYYHCSKEHEFEREVVGPDGATETETVSCADDPCSCVPHKRTTRWGCLGALSLALPCLWCYWPMRGCVAICARCYAKHSRHGCRCTQHPTGVPLTGSALLMTGGTGGGGGSIFGGGGGGVGVGGANAGLTNGTGGRESNAKGVDSVDGDSPLQHLHHHLRHHLNHHHHRSAGASPDLTTPEKRLLDSSVDNY
uniref:Protein sprouty n=1 Tax=Anopheles farauti TaxID=69004 RepID=A0A182QNU1_9DIPT